MPPVQDYAVTTILFFCFSAAATSNTKSFKPEEITIT